MITKDGKKAAELLSGGSVGVISTDTIYGISCLASREDKVEYIYSLKEREKDKPFIILIPKIDALSQFGVSLSEIEKEMILKLWPGPVSIIFNVNPSLTYLHRGKGTLAFRLPDKKSLLEILNITGPIVSTSANISNEAHANNANEAQKIFGDKMDFYLDEGNLVGEPSRIAVLKNEQITFLR